MSEIDEEALAVAIREWQYADGSWKNVISVRKVIASYLSALTPAQPVADGGLVEIVATAVSQVMLFRHGEFAPHETIEGSKAIAEAALAATPLAQLQAELADLQDKRIPGQVVIWDGMKWQAWYAYTVDAMEELFRLRAELDVVKGERDALLDNVKKLESVCR